MNDVTGILLVLGLSISIQVASAQDDLCEPIVQEALTSVMDACEGVEPGEACYASGPVEAEFQAGSEAQTFSQPGDSVDLADLGSLSLGALDTDSQTWGVVVVRAAPAAATNEDITLVLFGELDFRNVIGTPPAAVDVTATGGINIRRGPSTNTAVIGGLGAGETVTAIGRLEDSSWLHVRLPGSPADLGWVFAELVTPDGDLDTLAVVDPNTLADTPVQAFDIGSDNPAAGCEGVPQGGVLMQSPADALITFVVNGSTLRLRGTGFLQAGDEIVVSIMEGSAQVTVGDDTQYIPAGTQFSVQLDDEGMVDGMAESLLPYDEAFVQMTPVGLLPRDVTIVPALTAEEITAQTACLASAHRNANQRGGPGTGYLVQGRLADGEIVVPDGQARGSDGMTWLHLESGNWVRSDLVEIVGDCDGLPEVEAPPPPVSASTGYRIEICEFEDEGVDAGQTVQFTIAGGSWPSRGEALEALSELSGTIAVNGEALPIAYDIFAWDADNYGVLASGIWAATSGTHTVTGSLSLFDASESCTFSVD